MQKIFKSIIDKILAFMALIVLGPIMIIAAAGIKVSSKGPVFYMAKRMGRGMQPFTVYKFRTMRVNADKEGAITGVHDSRIFVWGNFLRKTKIDELPQLINILNGTMAVIGPRPEDIDIVNKYYTEEEKKTLKVLPGLACPGSIYNYTHGDLYLSDNATDATYVKNFLHIKLALDMYYLNHWSLLYDIELIFRTVYAIVITSISNNRMNYPKEYIAVFGTK